MMISYCFSILNYFLQIYRFVDTKDYVVPLLAVIAADIEPAVRQHLVEKVTVVAKVMMI